MRAIHHAAKRVGAVSRCVAPSTSEHGVSAYHFASSSSVMAEPQGAILYHASLTSRQCSTNEMALAACAGESPRKPFVLATYW